ncbi:Do family serine endopeptidase [Phreatobacter oligotrophus]|jgi:serine protease Do|uniref:Do family serine endopeptidase n=1 Tax=Phreatobacter oligotrophus TaxID=1122261 RepID=UPI002352745C|nr:Do family serine endopeptidase [Phreatobacter oligotrophus]MBX9989031.1 Do family serine endopeptidase [Phreatobacter oligotrophus]
MTSPTKTPGARIRAALLGTVAIAAVGAGIVAWQPARAPFVAAATAQGVQTAPMSFADVVERVKPAVVSVRVTQAAPQAMNYRELPGMGEDENGDMERFMRRFGEQFRNDPRFGGPRGGQGPQRGGPRAMSQGSGFFISADGFIVTNNHVVRGATEADVVLDDGRTVKARVVGTDERTDLALLKAEGRDFPFVAFARNAPRIGDWVLAVGNPFGLGGTVTAGIVSARGRDIGSGPYDDFIQIDAAVNRGNSGGPTFNVNGEVIGVNTAIFSPSGGNVGIAFAIPSETTQNVVAALREGGSVQRGWIGVQIQGLTPEIAESLRLTKPEGALVAGIQPGSPAAASDLKPSDVIVSVDGQPVKDARELTRRIGAARPGTTVRLGVIRDGAERNVGLTLGRLPGEGQMAALQDGRRDRRSDAAPEANPTGPRLGLSVEPAGRGQGLVVTEVDPSGPAAQRGIRPGDVILDVAGRSVSSLRDVREALGAARADGRRSALIRLRSGEGQRFVAIPLDPG